MAAATCLALLLALFSLQLSCNSADLQWWQTSVVYQIYPRSFQDSNGDGVGDLKGIQSRLDYLQGLGVGAIWISPFHESPMKDFGYDSSNQTNVDPLFGTLQDFDDLVKDIHSRGMKIINDFVPGYTSDLHPWFKESEKGGENNPYADYYVWHEGKVLPDGSRAPPNNWLSIFGGPAWHWSEKRQAYYYHIFVKEQPDLNYRSERLRKDMQDTIKFWLDRGIDGLRVDAIALLFENNFDVDDVLVDPTLPSDQYWSYTHHNTEHQPQVHDVIREWKELFDEYERRTGKHIFTVMEVYDVTMKESMKYYESGGDMPYNFNFIDVLTPKCGGHCLHKAIDSWMTEMPEGKWPNFVLSNHDNKRVTTRKGERYADCLNLLLLTLPGTPTTYQGEEIAMRDIWLTFEETVDPWGVNFGPERYTKFSRDPCRSPMQWDSSKNAGFSTADKTWLPVGEDYKTRNVESQMNAPSGRSSVLLYKSAVRLRNHPAFQNSRIEYSVITDDILSFIRSDGTTSYLVAINAGLKSSTDDYTSDEYGSSGHVLLTTPEFTDLQEGSLVSLKALTLAPGDGVVIKLQKSKDEL